MCELFLYLYCIYYTGIFLCEKYISGVWSLTAGSNLSFYPPFPSNITKSIFCLIDIDQKSGLFYKNFPYPAVVICSTTKMETKHVSVLCPIFQG